MSKTTISQPPSSLDVTGDSMLSAPSSPLPMSFEVPVSNSHPAFSYRHDNSKANDQLIQKATTRLRCRLLQQGLIDAKSKVSHLQDELDNLRIELSTTENVLSKFGEPDDRQLLALERRFNTHQQQLDLLLSSSTIESQPKPTPQLQENAITASTSFSSTLSRVSSIFSTRRKPFRKTTTPTTDSSIPFGPHLHFNHLEQQHADSSVTNDSCSTTEYDNDLQHTGSDLDTREKRMRRRQRVKQLSQEYQQRLRTYDPTWKEDGDHDWQPAPSMIDNNNKNTANKPTTAPQFEKQKPAKMQQPHTPTPTNNTMEKKRTVTKQTLNTTKKPMMTSTKPIQPSKPAAAPCLCKRNKTTNKADPFKAAPSPHPPTSHSRKPEMELLETQKHPLSPLPAETVAKGETTRTTPPLDAHVLPLPPSTAPVYHADDPRRPSNVSDWLMKQHQYHLQQQQQRHNNNNNNGDDHDDDEEDMEGAWMKKETSIDNHPLNGTMNIGNNNSDIMKPMPPRTGTQSKQQQQSSSVFDDVLRYLDSMSDLGNDSGLQQDISHLLAPMYNSDSNNTRAPSTYSSSVSMSSIYSSLSWSTAGSQAHWSSLLTNHDTVGKYFSRYLVGSVNKSLSWCKFLSVLSLALLISLGRGPSHMLLSLDDLDHLNLMADQGEPLVYSYYL